MELNVAVWGSTGFAGQELVGLLEQHPNIGNIDKIGREIPENYGEIDVAFLALPHSESAQVAKQLSLAGSSVIDLSGDLRFPTGEEYARWYGTEHAATELLPVPYGLPELYRDSIKNSRITSIPGCYPTAVLLGIVPLIEGGHLSPADIVVDAVSGVSGTGKTPTTANHFVNIASNAVPYKIGRAHRHVGEIEQFLQGRRVFFSPTLIPIERGMLTKSTVRLQSDLGQQALLEVLDEKYNNEPLVHVLDTGAVPEINDTIRTDMCFIGVVTEGKTAQIVCSIDNLRKGASGQAVQVFNVLHGFDETTGLTIRQPA